MLTRALDLLEDAAAAVLERAGDGMRDRVDELAVRWLMTRRGLPRRLALPLLERLGVETGARIEVRAPLH
jgi:hypothetical protein